MDEYKVLHYKGYVFEISPVGVDLRVDRGEQSHYLSIGVSLRTAMRLMRIHRKMYSVWGPGASS